MGKKTNMSPEAYHAEQEKADAILEAHYKQPEPKEDLFNSGGKTEKSRIFWTGKTDAQQADGKEK
jgi:hypothetical protein